MSWQDRKQIAQNTQILREDEVEYFAMSHDTSIFCEVGLVAIVISNPKD